DDITGPGHISLHDALPISWTFEPRRVEKPWGWELIWAHADQYVGKLLFVRAGESLSLQFHREKDESWLVQEGRAKLELAQVGERSEEHTSELQSLAYLVCR